jgi:hypothetical protein
MDNDLLEGTILISHLALNKRFPRAEDLSDTGSRYSWI